MQEQEFSPVDVFDSLFEAEKERPAIRKAGIEALHRLVPVAQRDTGQSGVIGRFLLGLYNGQAYPFDLTELRRLDAGLFDDCLLVLRLDNRPEQEVHTYLPNGDAIWADFRARWAAPALADLERDASRFRRLRNVPDELLGAPGVPCVAVPAGPNSGRYVSGEDLDAAMGAPAALGGAE